MGAEIEDITKKYLNRKNEKFVAWIPHNVKTAIINVKPEKVEHSATMVGNITSVKDCFERIWESFNKLFEKKAFLHWYRGEGIHEMEFVDAECQVKDLIMEYFEKQETVISIDDVEDYEYEEEEVESLQVDMEQIMNEQYSESEHEEETMGKSPYIKISQSHEAMDTFCTCE